MLRNCFESSPFDHRSVDRRKSLKILTVPGKKNKENVFLHDIQGIFQQLENTIRPKMTQRMR